ncbi:hypothetical protein OCOJLMKI_4203 [Methylobacterium iners]|uniref:HNH domain-containing protein n=1 Tax=Methylobacterium iners TaxID=418707 RepID=A0ABQ4S5N0_9HYPH|nr:hypothetical protein OCOJLMKI_4203 [Methylobacterium iners]
MFTSWRLVRGGPGLHPRLAPPSGREASDFATAPLCRRTRNFRQDFPALTYRKRWQPDGRIAGKAESNDMGQEEDRAEKNSDAIQVDEDAISNFFIRTFPDDRRYVIKKRTSIFGYVSYNRRCTSSDVMRNTKYASENISSFVHEWVEEGYLTREPDQYNRRFKILDLTPKGVALLREYEAALAGDVGIREGNIPIQEGRELAEGIEDGTVPDRVIEHPCYQEHRRLERETQASAMAKRRHGYRCQACDLDFEERYGSIGRGFIEAHHLRPVASLPKDEDSELALEHDFAVLCANCHRMIHRYDDPGDLEGFRRLVRSRS